MGEVDDVEPSASDVHSLLDSLFVALLPSLLFVSNLFVWKAELFSSLHVDEDEEATRDSLRDDAGESLDVDAAVVVVDVVVIAVVAVIEAVSSVVVPLAGCSLDLKGRTSKL